MFLVFIVCNKNMQGLPTERSDIWLFLYAMATCLTLDNILKSKEYNVDFMWSALHIASLEAINEVNLAALLCIIVSQRLFTAGRE